MIEQEEQQERSRRPLIIRDDFNYKFEDSMPAMINGRKRATPNPEVFNRRYGLYAVNDKGPYMLTGIRRDLLTKEIKWRMMSPMGDAKWYNKRIITPYEKGI